MKRALYIQDCLFDHEELVTDFRNLNKPTSEDLKKLCQKHGLLFDKNNYYARYKEEGKYTFFIIKEDFYVFKENPDGLYTCVSKWEE